MKFFFLAFFIFICCFTNITAAQQAVAKNVIIITLDGTRWQEVFKGADEELLHNSSCVKDTSLMLQQYWAGSPEERRRILLPFFWTVIAKQGQLLGNRDAGNKVNVANLYKISYPGYSEIFTGFADKLFIPNLTVNNHRANVLQALNRMPEYKGKIAAFCSWRVLPFVLDEKNGDLPVNAGYENAEETDSLNALINQVQETVSEKGHTRHDLLTFEYAKNYLVQQHPRVLYLGLGETDEFAHHGSYDSYLQKIHQADAMIAELWYLVQTDPFYRSNTSFIITTDHGRGSNASNWNTHGFWVRRSGETWMAMLGAGIAATGEDTDEQQLYQKQLAATVANLLGVQFTANHPVAASLVLAPADKNNEKVQAAVAVSSK